MKIFISHAWENKSFARPLAEALRAAGHEVWFDEYEFKAGDSLLGKINEGLLEADYGVVVFSPEYFRKYWTKVELDGLVALQARNGKMVLPVWLNISSDEIAKVLPTHAGCYAITAGKDMDRVVAELLSAIDGSERQRVFSRSDKARARIQKISAARKAQKIAFNLLQSLKGVQLAAAEAARLIEATYQACVSLSTDELSFKLGQENGHAVVQAPARLRLMIRYVEGASNNAENAQLQCVFYQFGRLLAFGDRESGRKREEMTFWPYFTESERVVWSSSKDRDSFESTDSVVEHLVDMLSQMVEAETT